MAGAEIATLNRGDNARYGRNFTQFAKPGDVAHLRGNQYPSGDGRIPLGAFRDENDKSGDLLYARYSVIVIGPTRSGKTTGITIPTLLRHMGPIVTTSARLDTLDATHNYRRQLSPHNTHVFAPLETERFRYPRSGWSPLTYASTWEESQLTTTALIGTSPVSGDEVKDRSFWNERAASIIAPLLYAARLARNGTAIMTLDGQRQEVAGNMGTVYSWNSNKDFDEPLELLRARRDMAAGEYAAYTMLLEGADEAALARKHQGDGKVLESLRIKANEEGASLDNYASKMDEAEDAYFTNGAGSALDAMGLLDRRMDRLGRSHSKTTEEASTLQYERMGTSRVMEIVAAKGGRAKMTQEELLFLQREAAKTKKGAGTARARLESTTNLSDDARSIVESVVDAMISPYQYERVQAATAKDDIDIQRLFDEKGCLYVVVAPGEQHLVKPVVDQLMGVIDLAAVRRNNEGRTLDPELIYALDEAGIGGLKNLEDMTNTALGTGRKVVSVWQSYAQLVRQYGREGAEIIFGGHPTLVVLAGTRDEETLRRVRELGGETFVKNVSGTYEVKEGGHRKHTGETINLEVRDLLTAPFVREGAPYSAVVFDENTPVTVVDLKQAKDLYPPQRR